MLLRRTLAPLDQEPVFIPLTRSKLRNRQALPRVRCERCGCWLSRYAPDDATLCAPCEDAT